MNKRRTKKRKNFYLEKPMMAIREYGLLNGYTCPRCGNHHVKEPYCRNCNQMLIYDVDQVAPSWKSNEEWEAASRRIMGGGIT